MSCDLGSTDADKQASKRSRMSTRDDQPSETSSHGENGTGGGQSSTSNSLLPVWELATVLGPGAASLHSGRRSSSVGADRGRSEVDTLGGSKDSSESQEDSDDDGEDGDDKSKDKRCVWRQIERGRLLRSIGNCMCCDLADERALCFIVQQQATAEPQGCAAESAKKKGADLGK